MAQSNDPKLVEFLTSSRNVRCVLEVLSHSETIRSTLAARFWSQLRTHLTKIGPSDLARKLKWDFGSEPPGAKRGCAWLDAQISQYKDRRQSLFYRIEYGYWPQGLDIYYGLHWKVQMRS